MRVAAEGYRPRSLYALRPYLERIEAHKLAGAGVQFDAAVDPGKAGRPASMPRCARPWRMG